jgi:TRAP-type C4-dicarboxylate transport system permease small subunit
MRIVKIINSVSQYMGYVATSVLTLMMLLTVSDVFGRYFINHPIPGTTEISELMMVVVVFPAMAWCTVARRHVKVDLIMSYLPKRVQMIIDTITLLIALGGYVIVTWRSFIESTATSSVTGLLKIPYMPFFGILTIGFAMFCLAIIAQLIENATREVEK